MGADPLIDASYEDDTISTEVQTTTIPWIEIDDGEPTDIVERRGNHSRETIEMSRLDSVITLEGRMMMRAVRWMVILA